jgi:hypothetical protein
MTIIGPTSGTSPLSVPGLRLFLYASDTHSMGLAVALLAHRSLALELYAATLDGRSIDDLASEYALSTEWIQERLTAVRYALKHQVG